MLLLRVYMLQVDVLNDCGDFPSNAEVVVAPPAIFVPTVKDNIRSDIKVGQVSHFGFAL